MTLSNPPTKGMTVKPVNGDRNSVTIKSNRENYAAKRKKKILVASSSSNTLNVEQTESSNDGSVVVIPFVRSKSTGNVLRPKIGVRFNPQVQERILYKQASKTILMSQQLSARLNLPIDSQTGTTNSGDSNASILQDIENTISLMNENGTTEQSQMESHLPLESETPDVGSLPIYNSPNHSKDVEIYSPELEFTTPPLRTPCIPPQSQNNALKVDRANQIVNSEPHNAPGRAKHQRSHSSSSPVHQHFPDANPVDRGESFAKRTLVKLRSRSIDSAILENSSVIPTYMTMYGYELEFKGSLRTFDFNPSSWVQVIMDMPEGLNKFRKVVVSKSPVQFHNFLPRWKFSLYLEDVYGGHKAPIEVQLWILNHLREPILAGSTQTMIVEDLIFSKPGKTWTFNNTLKKKSSSTEIPAISIVSSKKSSS